MPVMLSPVSTNDPRQDAQSLLVEKQVQQKQQDDARVRNNQPSSFKVQRADDAAHKQVSPEFQNSQQAKGASLDVRA